MSSVLVRVEVVTPVRKFQGVYELEREPPTVHVVTVTTPYEEWREEVHGGREACLLFVRGVRAGARLAGVTVDLPLEWT